MISQTAEYALRAVVCLAQSRTPAMTTHQVAAITQVPSGYLAKVLSGLARAGLVQSQRGLHGGHALARPADRITVLDVLKAVDPPKRITGCPLGIASHRGTLCPLHRQLDDAIAMIERTFAGSTVADLISPENGVAPLCEGPCSEGAGIRLTQLPAV